MNRIATLLLFALIVSITCVSQDNGNLLAGRQDSIRGSITAERAWWDVLHYAVTVEPDFETKTITGTNVITFKTLKEGQRMQIDLQQPMHIESASADNYPLEMERSGNVYYINFRKPLQKSTTAKLIIKFSGKPREAVNPPWDGGWIWKKDSYGNPWMSVACQGLGASVWYPCKDHQSDEPDSASLSMIVADTLMAVGNGRLSSTIKKAGKNTYTWKVVNPINSYNIIPYIGRYTNWGEKFNGENGVLDVNYWVLEENVDKAKNQFRQVPKMLKCFEHWFGPYPFYEDGYKLVESPHLGMEHQSAIAYGNGFENGYLGKDLSGTGWGNKWDFIIVHESGHEWFANNITTEDIADMWVHEGFTNYSEVLFTTCEYGIEAGNDYAVGLRNNIQNDKPLIGKYGVNQEGSIDMYYKGSNLVHMIRQIIDNDEKFRELLRNMNKDFWHQTVTSSEIEQYINAKSGLNLDKLFDQYLRTTQVPVFEYKINAGKLRYRWNNCISGFNMPLRITVGKTMWIHPSPEWKELKVDASSITVDRNFYIGTKQL